VKRKFFLKQAKNSLLLILAIFLTVFSVIGCSRDERSAHEYARLYADMLVVNEKYASDPVKIRNEKEKLFLIYDIPEKEYEEKIKSFEADRAKWEEFFKAAADYLDTLKTRERINQ